MNLGYYMLEINFVYFVPGIYVCKNKRKINGMRGEKTYYNYI
jgi:hypothetical protein